jgi:hypothetical protein
MSIYLNATATVILITSFTFFQKMASSSKKKNTRKSWSEEDTATAVGAIKNKKMGWLKATKTYSMPTPP